MQNNDAGVRDLKSLEGWGGGTELEKMSVIEMLLNGVRKKVIYRNTPASID